MDDEKLKEAVRSLATADIFRSMASEDASEKALAETRGLPDELLDLAAKSAGVPEDQYSIHRAMVRNESNVFTEELGSVDGLLRPGDVILMTGTSAASKALVELQKPIYSAVRSSHAALVHADFVCIDAMPKVGVSNRIVPDLLHDVADDWRVIRCHRLKDIDAVMRACAFYLAQPYKVLPAKRSAKNYAYCSELVRKVYNHCGVSDVGIVDDYVIAPAHLDRLAEGDPNWVDITEEVRPAVEFCRKYAGLVRMVARLFIEGLQLNRKRFEERAAWLEKVKKLERAGRISKEKARESANFIREMESNMNHTFWDVRRPQE